MLNSVHVKIYVGVEVCLYFHYVDPGAFVYILSNPFRAFIASVMCHNLYPVLSELIRYAAE